MASRCHRAAAHPGPRALRPDLRSKGDVLAPAACASGNLPPAPQLVLGASSGRCSALPTTPVWPATMMPTAGSREAGRASELCAVELSPFDTSVMRSSTKETLRSTTQTGPAPSGKNQSPESPDERGGDHDDGDSADESMTRGVPELDAASSPWEHRLEAHRGTRPEWPDNTPPGFIGSGASNAGVVQRPGCWLQTATRV